LNYERTKELTEQNLIAKQELDNAETAMKVAKANYESAATRLGYASITAPFSGYITKRFLDAGANVTSNNVTLFTLMDIEEMKILINVLEKDIPLIAKGKKAVITVDAYPGKEFYGTVTKLSQAVDLSTRTMAVEVDIPNNEHFLKPGMFANVTLVVDEHKNVITVAIGSLMKDEKGSFVYTVNGNIAHRKNISAGVEQEMKVEILSGIQDGDTIMMVGQQFVKDGAPVIIQQ
jgi:RND family efflux transporter MFP subunit